MPYRATSTVDGLIDEASYRLPDGSFPLRDGSNPVERMALHRVNLDLAALPATTVIQLAMWPNIVATLARQCGRSTAMFYNALTRANGRPYHSVRRVYVQYLRQLAAQQGEAAAAVTKAAIDHLLDANPAAHHGGTPLPAPGRRDQALPPPADPGWDPLHPPGVRTGGNPLERMALRALHRHLPAMPASEVAQLAIWPSSLASWAKSAGLEPGAVYNAFAWRNGWAYRKIREAFAAFAGVSGFAVDALIEAPRRLPPAPTPFVAQPTGPEQEALFPAGD